MWFKIGGVSLSLVFALDASWREAERFRGVIVFPSGTEEVTIDGKIQVLSMRPNPAPGQPCAGCRCHWCLAALACQLDPGSTLPDRDCQKMRGNSGSAAGTPRSAHHLYPQPHQGTGAGNEERPRLLDGQFLQCRGKRCKRKVPTPSNPS